MSANGTSTLFTNTGSSYNGSVGLAVDSAGDLFTGNPSNSTVTEYSASGVTSTYATVDSVSGLTFSANGTLYGTSPNYNTVFLLNQQTHAYSDFASTPNANLFLPRGLVFDGSGNLYVANLGEFNNSGSFNNEGMTSPYANTIEKFSSTGTDLGAFATGLDEPYGLAFNLSGDLFVSNVGNNTIDEFSTGGGLLKTITQGLDDPQGLAIDSSGNLYVANAGSGTIEEFEGDGTYVGILASGLNSPSSIAIGVAPEPATWALVLLATPFLLGLGLRRRLV